MQDSFKKSILAVLVVASIAGIIGFSFSSKLKQKKAGVDDVEMEEIEEKEAMGQVDLNDDKKVKVDSELVQKDVTQFKPNEDGLEPKQDITGTIKAFEQKETHLNSDDIKSSDSIHKHVNSSKFNTEVDASASEIEPVIPVEDSSSIPNLSQSLAPVQELLDAVTMAGKESILDSDLVNAVYEVTVTDAETDNYGLDEHVEMPSTAGENGVLEVDASASDVDPKIVVKDSISNPILPIDHKLSRESEEPIGAIAADDLIEVDKPLVPNENLDEAVADLPRETDHTKEDVSVVDSLKAAVEPSQVTEPPTMAPVQELLQAVIKNNSELNDLVKAVNEVTVPHEETSNSEHEVVESSNLSKTDEISEHVDMQLNNICEVCTEGFLNATCISFFDGNDNSHLFVYGQDGLLDRYIFSLWYKNDIDGEGVDGEEIMKSLEGDGTTSSKTDLSQPQTQTQTQTGSQSSKKRKSKKKKGGNVDQLGMGEESDESTLDMSDEEIDIAKPFGGIDTLKSSTQKTREFTTKQTATVLNVDAPVFNIQATEFIPSAYPEFIPTYPSYNPYMEGKITST